MFRWFIEIIWQTLFITLLDRLNFWWFIQMHRNALDIIISGWKDLQIFCAFELILRRHIYKKMGKSYWWQHSPWFHHESHSGISINIQSFLFSRLAMFSSSFPSSSSLNEEIRDYCSRFLAKAFIFFRYIRCSIEFVINVNEKQKLCR